jgi:energy-coupling factor transporter ATP-binding protein EcfA2
MIVGITPLTFEITPRNGGTYKSISTLSWADIPGFAILTGKNGSGKTQLLEIMAYHFSGASPPEFGPNPLPVEVQTTGVTYTPDEIAYVPSGGRFSGGPAVSLQTMAQFRQQALQHVRNMHGQRNDIPSFIRSHRILNRLGGKVPPSHGDQKPFEELLNDADFVADDIDITAGLTYVFMAHRFKLIQAHERKTPGFDKDGKFLGPAPWDVLNEALGAAGFPYQVISPLGTDLLGHYDLRLKDQSSGLEIAARDLSSGEKVLLQLVLWLFSASKQGQFPKLLLLDEPDAHLHPSMTTQFLDVISEVLVNRHNVRVIMTSHSPSTIALAPDGAVFQLERGASKVIKVRQRSDIISVLTAGLVTVSRTTKFCFVEDENDVVFYAAVYDVLMDHGPNRDPMALLPAPSMAFIPASVGSGREKIAGGCSVVKKWVEKLDAEPLDRTFFGIIDKDAANVSSGRLHVLGRYSFENYLLDPLNLYCVLLEEGDAPSIPGVQISFGSEHLLRLQPNSDLQAIADNITAKMETIEPKLATTATYRVSYTADRHIEVPSWVIDHRGHDLLPIAQRAFGGARVITPPRLVKALRRGRLLPVELATILATIQRA